MITKTQSKKEKREPARGMMMTPPLHACTIHNFFRYVVHKTRHDEEDFQTMVMWRNGCRILQPQRKKE
jgi:hypothetical protein